MCMLTKKEFNVYAGKKLFNKKAKKCLMGQIVIESHSFLEYWQNHVPCTYIHNNPIYENYLLQW